jgi:Cu2+-containing amine oxidase
MLPPYNRSSPETKTTITIPTVRHPLSPLTGEEIAASIAILRASGKATSTMKFSTVTLNEPSKEFVLNFKPNTSIERESRIHLTDADGTIYEATVSVSKFNVKEWNKISEPLPARSRDQLNGKDLNNILQLQPNQSTPTKSSDLMAKDYVVNWRSWSLRIGYTPREGLVLYGITFGTGNSANPVIYRASLGDIAILSDSATVTSAEFGIGTLISPQTKSPTVPTDIRFFDTLLTTSRGEVARITNAIAVYQEDISDATSPDPHRLVITCGSTLQNHHYDFFWSFYPDGLIQFEVKSSSEPESGKNNQHIINVRLDMMIGSLQNQAIGPGNSVLTTESDVQSNTSSSLKIVNASINNSSGNPIGYRFILPENSGSPISSETNLGFISKDLWITPHQPKERYALGECSDGGLSEWVKANRSIENTNIVLWNNLVINDSAEAGDSSPKSSFIRLMPDGFLQ